MVAGKKIGVVYAYNENWIGGTYYVQNLIAALKHLPQESQPDLIVISNEEKHVDDLRKNTGYEKMAYRPLTFRSGALRRYINVLGRTLTGKAIIQERHSDLDIVFPVMNHEHMACFSNVKNPLFWVPDFQDKAMPEFFSAGELSARKDFQTSIVASTPPLVLSSRSAARDFNTLYTNNKVKQFLLPFAVSHPPTNGALPPAVREKYGLTGEFFICSNQFWKHKNHPVVLKAIKELKDSGKEVQVVFTGKEHDHRFPHYFEELKALAAALGIQGNIRFLGFIDRADQVALMKEAVAVIQPSLFEGWSTVVEDSKAIGAALIVSDIPVHREQLTGYPRKNFFTPGSEKELAEALCQAREESRQITGPAVYDYENDVKAFANAFVDILENLAGKPS